MANRFTRRRFLGDADALAGVAIGAGALPPSLRAALADAPPAQPLPSLNQIEHVVFCIQENRSFDHYFGTLRGVRGFDDPTAITLSTGKSVFYQPDPVNPDGYELPFHLDTLTTNAAAVVDLSHAWAAQHGSWNGGAMDAWLSAHRVADGNANGPMTMGYYTRADLPFHFALADAFTVCDHYHCSVFGPTNPNQSAHDRHLTLEHRRVLEHRGFGSHVDAPLPGTALWDRGDKHQRLEACYLR